MLRDPNRRPERYPASFHTLLHSPPGTYLFGVFETKREAWTWQRKFSSFRSSLETYHWLPLAEVHRRKTIRLTKEEGLGGKWEVWAEVREGGMEERKRELLMALAEGD